jgi:hypothetical protein
MMRMNCEKGKTSQSSLGEDFISPTAADKRRYARAGRWAGSLLAANVLFAVPDYGPAIEDVLLPYRPTVQEATIARALDVAYDTKGVNVHCLSYEETQRRTWPRAKKGEGFPLTNTVWLRDSACDTLTGLPLKTGGLADSLQGVQSERAATAHYPETLNALHTASHEAAHSIMNTQNESAAECFSIQTGATLATVLGVADTESAALRHALIENLQRGHTNTEQMRPYHFDARCVDGGELDLQPASVGEFPTRQ